jgi:hypothetical protein
MKPILLFLLLTVSTICRAQNLYTALHLNDNHEYRFGKPKQIIEENTFYTPSYTHTEKNVKVFDSAGMLFSEERYNQEGILTAKLTYTNDATRHIILSRIFEQWLKYGRTKEITVYKYNDQGFLISSTDSTGTGKLIDVAKTTNNSKGHPAELNLFNARNEPSGKETAEYNYDKNTVVITVFKNDGTKLSADTSKVNQDSSQNEALSYSIKSTNGSVTLFESEYQYDSKGNWIEQKIYKVEPGPNDQKKRTLNKWLKRHIAY